MEENLNQVNSGDDLNIDELLNVEGIDSITYLPPTSGGLDPVQIGGGFIAGVLFDEGVHRIVPSVVEKYQRWKNRREAIKKYAADLDKAVDAETDEPIDVEVVDPPRPGKKGTMKPKN